MSSSEIRNVASSSRGCELRQYKRNVPIVDNTVHIYASVSEMARTQIQIVKFWYTVLLDELHNHCGK